MKYAMNIKTLIPFILLSSILSCVSPNEKSVKQTKDDSSFQNDNAADFLELFTKINIDTFHIYSSIGKKPDNKFLGTQIDKRYYHFFKFDTILTYNLIDDRGPKESIHACYKFKLSDNTTGLLLRTPSLYEVTAVDLYIWDNTIAKIIGREYLSDGYGDEGFEFVQDAWITDIDKDGNIDIIKRRKDHDIDLDDESKVSSSDSIFAFLWRENKFVKSSIRIEPVKFPIHYWQWDN